jgi:hypothetical protein
VRVDREGNRGRGKKLRGNRYRRFLVRLSLKWGIPVSEITRRFSGDEITELQGLEYLEPWGYAMENHRAALAAYVTVCVNSEQGKAPEYGARFCRTGLVTVNAKSRKSRMRTR